MLAIIGSVFAAVIVETLCTIAVIFGIGLGLTLLAKMGVFDGCHLP